MNIAQAGPESWKLSSHERSADRLPEIEGCSGLPQRAYQRGKILKTINPAFTIEQGDSHSGTVSQ